MELAFEWDDEKARSNLAKHRVSFLTAAAIFANEILERIDDREDYGEIRLLHSAESTPRSTASSTPGATKPSSASSAPRKRAEMKLKSTIVRHSLSQIQTMRERGEDPTSPSAPEAESLGADFWSTARVVMPTGKTSVHLRLDSDIVDWFKADGKGHLTRMNAVLRAYVEAQKHPVTRN